MSQILSPSQIHGCAATACCRFFAQNRRFSGTMSDSNFDKSPFSSSQATFSLALAQALAPSWARAQRVRTLSRCALLKWLIIRLLQTSAVDAFAQHKMYGIVLRRSLCQTVPKQFEFAGRSIFSVDFGLPTPSAGALEEHHSVVSTRNGKRAKQNA
jgi:hypothetical protein